MGLTCNRIESLTRSEYFAYENTHTHIHHQMIIKWISDDDEKGRGDCMRVRE